jgi:hypothetical protein
VLSSTSMSNLHVRLNDLAQNFASAVLDAIRGSSLHDLRLAGEHEVGNGRSARKATVSGAASTAKGARSKGRLPRRSPEDIAKALDNVLAVLKGRAEGLRAEEIRGLTGLQVKEMPRVLKAGLASKKLRAKGQKRATTYFAK